MSAADRQLPGDAGYGAATHFDNQARAALRLANFLSAFLQLTDSKEMYGNYRGDRPLNEEQLFGEVCELFLLRSCNCN